MGEGVGELKLGEGGDGDMVGDDGGTGEEGGVTTGDDRGIGEGLETRWETVERAGRVATGMVAKELKLCLLVFAVFCSRYIYISFIASNSSSSL
jgi:hypothetical protein